MSGSSKISVIMPVYNTKEEYLREAIESILNQTYTDFEFIIINDGSTNNAEEVILSYEDDRIKYIKQENQGISKSRNNAHKIAQGEYIAVFDSDDISMPDRFEKEIKILDENHNIGVVSSWVEKIPSNKILKFPQNPKYMDFVTGCPINNPVAMIRKEILDKYNITYDEALSSAVDYDLWSKMIFHTEFYIIQEVLLKYRWHENNVSVKSNKEQTQNAAKIQLRMMDFLTNDKDLQKKIMEKANYVLKYSKIQKLFSIRNRTNGNKKQKILTICGFQIKLSEKNI